MCYALVRKTATAGPPHPACDCTCGRTCRHLPFSITSLSSLPLSSLPPPDHTRTAPQEFKLIRSPTQEGIILGRTSFNGTGAANWTLTWNFTR